jgi:hypothetical protein
LNKKRIPKKVHHLIPLVKEWGIGDDGYRDVKVSNADTSTLEKLVALFTDEVATDINDWLSDPEETEKLTKEYLQFSSFYMACLYAEEILKNRKMNQ